MWGKLNSKSLGAAYNRVRLINGILRYIYVILESHPHIHTHSPGSTPLDHPLVPVPPWDPSRGEWDHLGGWQPSLTVTSPIPVSQRGISLSSQSWGFWTLKIKIKINMATCQFLKINLQVVTLITKGCHDMDFKYFFTNINIIFLKNICIIIKEGPECASYSWKNEIEY